MHTYRLVQVDFLEGRSGGQVLGLLECLFESSVKKFGFHLFIFSALFEEAFAALSFFLQELRSVIQVGSSGWSWRRFVEENLTKLRVHFQPRPAAWTHNFRGFSRLLVHLHCL